MTCMDEIMQGLYLGGVTDRFEPSVLKAQGLTHVLTVMERPLQEDEVKDFRYLHVFALDLDSQDLLQDLEQCLTFVEEGRKQGGVLVHCRAGSSRSATVVLAYMMRTCSMSKTAALKFVQARRPIVSPNRGFLQQLSLFELMGCKVNEEHEEFRRYMLSKLAASSMSGFSKDQLPSSIYRPECSSNTGKDTVYRCKKCSRNLFLSNALMPHAKGEGESAFDWRSKLPANRRQPATQHKQKGNDDVDGKDSGDGGDDDDNDDLEEEEELCQVSLFVEPMVWMKGQIETVEGKLACPKCRAKLGSFVWYGERCPCGAWVAPAFHIQTGKVDAMRPSINIHIATPAMTAPWAPANQQAAAPSAPTPAPPSAAAAASASGD